jgi:hypothetical protein
VNRSEVETKPGRPGNPVSLVRASWSMPVRRGGTGGCDSAVGREVGSETASSAAGGKAAVSV